MRLYDISIRKINQIQHGSKAQHWAYETTTLPAATSKLPDPTEALSWEQSCEERRQSKFTRNLLPWENCLFVTNNLEDETDQAIEEPEEIMHINRDSESKYEKSDRHETFELNRNFQMLPKELYQENYEAINVELRLVKKRQGRKKSK
ncbi:uncharacterized protein TNCV_598551 [Trichonephila clavipes]|nr:uncharacterized protein TNCV_598551 [Trichonephila clavipes]